MSQTPDIPPVPPDPSQPPAKLPPPMRRNVPTALIIAVVLIMIAVLFWMPGSEKSSEISYGFFHSQLKAGNIVEAKLEGTKITGEFKEPVPKDPSAKPDRHGEPIKLKKEFTTYLPVLADYHLDDLHLPGLPHCQGVSHEGNSLPGLPHGSGDLREASSLHGLQARVLHQDDQLLALRAEVCSVHGHSVRAGCGLQAGAGDGMLPGPELLRTELLRRREGLRRGGLLQLIERDSSPRLGERSGLAFRGGHDPARSRPLSFLGRRPES